jgi:hypothetical protein
MKSFSHYLIESVSNDISHWKSEPYSQLGSNPGGIHYDENNNKHYVKFYRNPEQARAEYATNRIYDHMGINVPKASLVKKGSTVGISTPWNSELDQVHPHELRNTSPETAHHIAKMYHAAVLTKNWDIIGNHPYNIQKDHQGNIHNIDQGGSLHFRAMGGHKDYDAGVGEIHSLRDPGNSSGQVFNKVFSQHPGAEKQSLESSVKTIDPNHIHGIFKEAGFANHKEMADIFEKRRQALINHYKA